MGLDIRNIIMITVPALAGLFGIFWFTRRKKDPPIEQKKGAGKGDDVTMETIEESIVHQKVTPVMASSSGAGDASQIKPKSQVKQPTKKEIVEPIISSSTTKLSNSQPPQGKNPNQPMNDMVLDGIEAAESTLNAIDVKDLCSPTLDSETSESSESSQDSVVPNKLSVSEDTLDNIQQIVEETCNREAAQVTQNSQQGTKETVKPESHNGSPPEVQETPKIVKETPKVVQETPKEVEETPIEVKETPKEVKEEIVTPKDWAKESEGLTYETISDTELVVETDETQGHTSESQISSPSCGNCSPVENGNASSNSDTPSETSNDSGRGPTLTEDKPHKGPQETITYEFDFPSDMCGLFIGKRGKNIAELKEITGADISVKRKQFTAEVQLVCVEGTQRQIDKALRLIKQKFPSHQYNINYAPSAPETPMLTPEMMQLSLPEGVTVDVIVSSVVAPNHVFVQQPTHPTFHMLERLNVVMNLCYTQEPVPLLPRPIDPGIICAAPMLNGWYRAQVVQSHVEEDESEIKFVDYGGYMRLSNAHLRQIRSDFATLPFQAVECYMANVIPPKDSEAFPAEANAVMEEMVQNKMLQLQVHGHEEEDGVPYVQLYQVIGEQAIVINRELVNRGVAQWLEH